MTDMEKEEYLLRALADLRTAQLEGFGRMDGYFKAMNGRLRENEEKVAVLQDRSDRHEKEATVAKTTASRLAWWGKSGLIAGVAGVLPYVKDLFGFVGSLIAVKQ